MKKIALSLALLFLLSGLLACVPASPVEPGNSLLPQDSTTQAPHSPSLPPSTTSTPSETEAPSGGETTSKPQTTQPPKATTPPQTLAPPDPKPNPRGELLIYLDAGHGLKDPGAVGSVGGNTYYEKNLNLGIAQRAKKKLVALGYRVKMTREDDSSLLGGYDYNASYSTANEAVARREAAKRAGASLYLSVHCNAYAGEGRAHGPIVFYNDSSSTKYRAKSLATLFSDRISTANGAFPTAASSRVRGGSGYIVLKDLRMPALLLEVGFMTDREDLSLLIRADWQEACADAIARAVEAAYLDGLIS